MRCCSKIPKYLNKQVIVNVLTSCDEEGSACRPPPLIKLPIADSGLLNRLDMSAANCWGEVFDSVVLFGFATAEQREKDRSPSRWISWLSGPAFWVRLWLWELVAVCARSTMLRKFLAPFSGWVESKDLRCLGRWREFESFWTTDTVVDGGSGTQFADKLDSRLAEELLNNVLAEP